MAFERHKIEELLRQLPEHLHNDVLKFVQGLLGKKSQSDGGLGNNGTPSVRSFFGIWDCGNPRSGENDLIDADLAQEYSNSHEPN